MSNRKMSEVQVHHEGDEDHLVKELKVVNFDQANRLEVREFVFASFQTTGPNRYAEVKSKFGPLAATDDDPSGKIQRDRRFSINPLLRNPLSIQQEEARILDEKVKTIVEDIAEQAKKDAGALGYEDGYKKGFAEAHRKIQIEAASRIEQFDHFLKEMENARVDIFRINERVIVEMIFRISKLLIMKELATDREYILRLVKELIGKVGVRENITLRINPEDGEVIGLLKEGVEKAFGNITNFNVEMSSHVKSGGCEIETEWNVINASIENQLQEVHRALIPEGLGESSPSNQEDVPS